MKDILDFIGLETTLRAKEPLRITRPNDEIRDCLNEFKATIIEVRQNDDEFSMGTRFRGVYDTIYDEKESFTTIRDAMEQFQKSTGKQTRGSQMPGKGLTWVHLPSANMPFVVADYERHEPNNNMKDSQDIVDDYYTSRGSVIHDAPTLDEHYYHFARDKESQRDQAYRNKNQVFTKYLHPEWLVTSTSCAKIDNERTSKFVNAIVDHLRGQVEDGSRERGPNSATELSKVISDYCIGTYDRQQEIQESKSEKKKNGNQQSLTKDTSKDDASTDISGSTARHESKTSEISIRHIFSNFINRIGRQEAELYGQFSGQKRDLRQEEVDNSSSHGNLSTTEAAVKKAAQLLFEIKDVRDELNILRTIAEFQRKVQSRMNGRELTATSPILDEDLTAVYVRNDIDEMDQLAGRIKDALHTTITLYESEISLDQGKRVMMFTVITACGLCPEIRTMIWDFATRPRGIRGVQHFSIFHRNSVPADFEGHIAALLETNQIEVVGAPSTIDSTTVGPYSNNSTYTIDGGLWTACRESRAAMFRRYRPDEWAAFYEFQKRKYNPERERDRSVVHLSRIYHDMPATFEMNHGEKSQFFTVFPATDLIFMHLTSLRLRLWDLSKQLPFASWSPGDLVSGACATSPWNSIRRGVSRNLSSTNESGREPSPYWTPSAVRNTTCWYRPVGTFITGATSSRCGLWIVVCKESI
ncbi:hypothetical protein CcaCcLH18_00797 [Colletotrichum camelliae]|nr:hypothetical protein CcaCcLH18_00797 [Colletotrichum camelliae]